MTPWRYFYIYTYGTYEMTKCQCHYSSLYIRYWHKGMKCTYMYLIYTVFMFHNRFYFSKDVSWHTLICWYGRVIPLGKTMFHFSWLPWQSRESYPVIVMSCGVETTIGTEQCSHWDQAREIVEFQVLKKNQGI